jgi:hypothetical protein
MSHGYSDVKKEKNFKNLNIQIMGDNNIVNNGNARAINISGGNQTIKNSYNGIQKEEIDFIISRLSEVIGKTGQAKANELFLELKDELLKEKPKISLLKTLWSSLLILVPLIKNSGDLYDRVVSFLSDVPN